MLARLRRLFAPPVFEDEEKTRTSRFMITFSWLAIAVVAVLIVIRADATTTPALVLASIIPLLLGMQYLVRRGLVQLAGILTVTSLWTLMAFLSWQSDGLRDSSLLAFLVIIILCSLLLGWRAAVLTGLASIGMIWLLALREWNGLYPVHLDDPLSFARDLTGILLLVMVLIYLLITGWARTLRSAKMELQERLRAERKLQGQADYLNALNEVALGLLNHIELRPLLESILVRACELVDTDHGLIELALPDGSALRQELGCGVLAPFDSVLTRRGEGVTGTVWNSGKPLIIDDYQSWPYASLAFINAGFHSVMGVPLVTGDTVIGALAVAYMEPDRSFNAGQVDLMQRFAALAALAIDNARLYDAAQREIRERRAVEAALRASEDKFRKVFNNTNIAITIVTLETGVFLEANDAFWQLSGLDPDQAIGTSALDQHLWDAPSERQAFVSDLRRKGSLQNVKVEFPGRTSLAFYELLQIEDRTCILCMFHDVTEQMKTEDALRASEAGKRAILASIPDMIFEVSSDGTFLDFMASSEIAPVMPPAQFLGKKIQDLFPEAIANQSLFYLERALATRQVHAFEYGLPPGAETQFFEARVSAISPESAMIMVRDISQRKWIEGERENLIRELEDTNAELERFTYTVSHDLKSPLITIKGFLGFLEQDSASGNITRLKADIKRIADATDKMQVLLNELLDLSRVGRLANPSQEIRFEDLARETVELLYGRLHEKEIRVHIQEDLPVIYGDRQRLGEVVQNLVDNAAKFMGGADSPRIEIGQDGTENGMPVFFVRDNGIGIDPIHQERIFGLFNKLDARSEGTGIGLALVKRIIEVHGGRIWVQSAPGRGATFFFTLPLAPRVVTPP